MVRQLWCLLEARLIWEWMFRTDALVGFAVQLLLAVGHLLFFTVVYRHVDAIAGWTQGEALVLVGTVMLLSEMHRRLFREGLHTLPDLVRTGHLDHYVLKPLWSPVLIALRGADLSRLWQICTGCAVVAYGLSLTLTPSWDRFLLYILALILSLLIYVLMVFCLVCLSFWLIAVHNLFFIVYDMMWFGRYPDSIYRGLLRTILTTILPLVALTSFPVRVLFESGSTWLLGWLGLVVLGFAVAGWVLWRRGLRRYQGAST